MEWVNRGAMEASPQGPLDHMPGPAEIGLYQSEKHHSFIDCVLSCKEPIRTDRAGAPIDRDSASGEHQSAAGPGSPVGSQGGKGDRDDAANGMLARPLRKPWKIEGM